MKMFFCLFVIFTLGFDVTLSQRGKLTGKVNKLANKMEEVEKAVEELNSKVDNLDARANMTESLLQSNSSVHQETVQLDNKECKVYNILDETDRGITWGPENYACDMTGKSNTSPMWKGTSWYRFMEPAGNMLARSAPGQAHCGTNAAGWTNAKVPTTPGSTLDIEVCFDDLCRWKEHARVTNCGAYFVYYLRNTPNCDLRYCAERVN